MYAYNGHILSILGIGYAYDGIGVEWIVLVIPHDQFFAASSSITFKLYYRKPQPTSSSCTLAP